MPVIPSYTAKEDLNPDTRGMPRPTFTTAAADAAGDIGKAEQGLGAQITAGADRIQAAAARYQEIQDKKTEFNTRLALDQFGAQIDRQDQEALAKTPEDGSGFTQSRIDNFQQQSETFLQEKVPPNLRAEYAARLATLQEKKLTAYSNTEAQMLNGYAQRQLVNDLQSSKEAVYNDPNALDERLRDMDERLKAAPIPASQKPVLLDKMRYELTLTAAGRIAPGDPQATADRLGIEYTPPARRPDGGPATVPGAPRADAGGTLESKLAARESSGNPGIVNKLGFAGLYQFGAPRLASLGLYKPGANEDMAGWNQASKNAPGKWSGTFTIPGHPEVKTLSDFLASPDAQRAAFGAHTAEIDKQIERRGLDEFIGKKVGGVTITRDGIVAMAHLGGIGSAEKALRSGGAANAKDANGSGVLSYAAMFQGGGNAPAQQAIQVATRGDTASDAPPAYASRMAGPAAAAPVLPAGVTPGDEAPEGGDGPPQAPVNVAAGDGPAPAPAPAPRQKLPKDPRFDILSLDDKLKLVRAAEAEQTRRARLAQTQSKAEAASVSRAMEDDLASIERTGQGMSEDKLNAARVAQVMGDEVARAWQAQRGRALKVHAALDGIETLSEPEVMDRLAQLEPQPGTDGYVEDMKTYQKAEQRARKFLDARNVDPALAVEAFPTVKDARAGAKYIATPNGNVIDPESAQAIIGARLTAQRQLGIDNPMAVTRSESRIIARQLRQIGDDNPQALDRFMHTLDHTYGLYADRVLSSVIQHQNVNRDLANSATDVLRKISMGHFPNIEDANRLEQMLDLSRVEQALTPPPSGGRVGGPVLGHPARDYPSFGGGSPATPANAAPAAPAAPARPQVTFRTQDILDLKNDRGMAPEFDRRYYPGAAEEILKEWDRRTAPRGR